MNAPATTFAGETAALVDLRKLAFRRLDITGAELAEEATEGHVMTHFPSIGLIFDVRAPATARNKKAALKAAADCDLLDRKGDWVIGEDVEVAALINRRFHDPAVDPRVAPNMPGSGWIYTATPAAWSSGGVWFVGLLSGNVVWNDDADGLVVPVLRVPPSQ